MISCLRTVKCDDLPRRVRSAWVLAELALGGLIDVITKMNLHLQISRVTNARIYHTYEEVNLIFPGSIAVRVEVAILPVGTGKDSKTNFGNIVVFVGAGLGPAEWALVGATTNVELVVVLGEWGQVLCFNLLRVSLSPDISLA